MIIEEAVKKFNQLPVEFQLEFGSDEFLHSLQSLEAAYNISLSGIAVQIIVGSIQFSDLSQVLEYDFSLSTTQATHLAKEIREKAFDPIIERLNFLDNDPDKTMTLDQQKNFAEKLFLTRLIQEIHHDPFIVDAINQRLFFILARDEDFHTRLERSLYENEEIVTSNPMVINGENVKGTVANWLKDFISQYGSQAYDSMSQSAFLINSENVKNITPAERELLAKVLKTYINIKFFPESMPSDDGEGWEIIPVDETSETEKSTPISVNEQSTEAAPTQPPVSQSQRIQPLPKKPTSAAVQKKSDTSKSKVYPVTTTPKVTIPTPAPVKKPIAPLPKPPAKTPAVQPTQLSPIAQPATSIDSSDELLNLKNMLLQYPPHSLEREAIEEEIKKIEKS